MIDYSYGAFVIETPEGGYIGVHQEFAPADGAIHPTAVYFIFFVDPVRGSFTFYIQRNDDFTWSLEFHPTFVTQSNIDIIGQEIENFDD